MDQQKAAAWREQIDAMPHDYIQRSFISLWKTVTRLPPPPPPHKKTSCHHNASIRETIHAPLKNFTECSLPPDDKT